MSMSNKIKYGLIPLLYLIGIYVSSFLVVHFNSEQSRTTGPCSALYILNNYIQLSPNPFVILYSLTWTSQFIALSTVTILLLSYTRLIELNNKCIMFAILASIIFQVSGFVAYEYIVAPVNRIIYGFEAAVMGPIGFIEDLLTWGFICLPLLIVTAIILKIRYKNIKSLIFANIIVFIALLVLHKSTTDLWFPPL